MADSNELLIAPIACMLSVQELRGRRVSLEHLRREALTHYERDDLDLTLHYRLDALDRLSQDGQRVLTWMRTSDPDLWLLDLASHVLTRLVTGVPARRAAWSPDGLHVLFDAPGLENPVTLYEADRGGGAHRLNAARNSQYAGTWTPDGRTIAYLDLTRATGFDIVTTGTEPQTPATPLLHSPANETGPASSPDGRWLAFVSDASKREEVYLVPYLPGTARPRVSDPVPLFTGEFDQRPASHPNYDVAADGRFLMICGTAPPTTDTRIAVLLRWDLQ
jgi:Tol biopolymer transport system component